MVGRDIAHGERIQWVVEGGVYKGSYLERSSTDGEDGDNTGEEGLLISEVCLFAYRKGV